MKKKHLLIIIILIMINFLTACTIESIDSSEKILAPNNEILPIEGSWIVEKVIDSPHKKINKEFINEKILFHKDGLIVGDKYILEPSFTMKNVKLSDYLLYKFKIKVNYLGIPDGQVKIIKVMGNNQCFYEFIKYKENKLILLVEEQFLFLKKQKDNVSIEEVNKYINTEKNKLEKSNINKSENLNTGLLLGIKSHKYDEIKEIDSWDYETIWIKSKNRRLLSVYKMEKLLLPRKKGFSLLNIERKTKEKEITDELKLTPETILNNENKTRDKNESILKNILYLGNDYISMEVINKSTNRKTLELYPIDKMKVGPSTRLSDLVSQQDMEMYLEDDKISNMDHSNFGLIRRNGYWIMKARRNYTKETKEIYEDYNIKIIPPRELVGYDELSIPWSRIKEKFPSAKDAFISPNKDIIVIERRNDILIYSIEDNKILEEELGKIKKASNDTIIMAEWSTDIYTDLWEREVLDKNGEAMEYN